jgi:hypothetical protein
MDDGEGRCGRVISIELPPTSRSARSPAADLSPLSARTQVAPPHPTRAPTSISPSCACLFICNTPLRIPHRLLVSHAVTRVRSVHTRACATRRAYVVRLPAVSREPHMPSPSSPSCSSSSPSPSSARTRLPTCGRECVAPPSAPRCPPSSPTLRARNRST